MNSMVKFATVCLATFLIAGSAIAQSKKDKTSKDKDEKTQEIVIREKGSSPKKMTIVIDGDNVTVNGKSVDEYKDDDVTIFKRDRPLAMAGPRMRGFDDMRPPFDAENFNIALANTNKAMLGVMTEKAENGVKVTEVTKESAAEKSGLKKEDVITKVDTTNITSPNELIEAISKYKPNDKVDITYRRDGKESKTTAKLDENKKSFSYNFNRDFNFNSPEGRFPQIENFNFNFNGKPRIGLQIQDIEEGKGVKVKNVDDDSPGAKAGIKEGDIITQVNGKDVSGVDDLRNATKDLKEGDTVKFTYKRDGKNQAAEIKLPKRLKSADL